MSFSSPQPKPARPLARSGSYISLTDMQIKHPSKQGPYSAHRHDATSLAAYTHIPRQPRERRKSVPRGSTSERITVSTKSARPTPLILAPATPPMASLRNSASAFASAPMRPIVHTRTHFPRSKPEPDLYRIAVTTRMRNSPEGQKILHMGPRLAFSIYNATRELEQIVASRRDAEGDVDMGDADGLLGASWVAVPREDWEMVDCAA